jgi:peroxiredoxin Q/BCP
MLLLTMRSAVKVGPPDRAYLATNEPAPKIRVPLLPFAQHMLKPGTNAPPLTLPDQEGRPFELAGAWSTGPIVLFFYPKADSAVCTKEACAFRDALTDLRALKATVVGISHDTCEAQKAFATRWGLPFTLLSDTAGTAHKAYDVQRVLGLVSERITYVIGSDGVVKGAYSGLLGSDRHVREAFDVLRGHSNL